MMSMPPRIELMGYSLPTDVEYFDLEKTFNFLEARFAGLFEGEVQSEKEIALLNILNALIHDNFCQAFIGIELREDFVEVYDIPRTFTDRQGDVGTHVISFDLKTNKAECDGIVGRLFVPANRLRYGVRIFVKERLSLEQQQQVELQRPDGDEREVKQTPEKKERLAAIQQFIQDTEARAIRMKKPFSKNEMPGTKSDLTSLLQKHFQNRPGIYRGKTFPGYYKELGMKFKRGVRPNITTFWKDVFPEYFC